MQHPLRDYQIFLDPVFEFVAENRSSTNTKLFSFLALLNAYVPDSYLLMSECLQILGPPYPIHGEPPFEERMKPFIDLINTSRQNSKVCLISQELARTAVERLAESGIFRSTTAENFIMSLCSDQPQPHIIQFIIYFLTKREFLENEQQKFSRLIEDILEKEENLHNAVSVLKTASQKLNQNPFFPQTISRLFYIRRGIINYDRAEQWARIAIDRAKDNSFVADTLGQVFKKRLLGIRNGNLEEINNWANEAFKAFKDVEKKADREVDTEMEGTVVSTSETFNNRGRFGFIEVAKIKYDKMKLLTPIDQVIRCHELEVIEKFQFFEWYLTYSQPDTAALEPPFFWNNVVCCYKYYTGSTAAKSTSFAGLLDCLSHGFFTSKGGRAGLTEDKKTVADLEAICADLKTIYEANTADVETAERYILSNVILSNSMPNSHQLAPMTTLQTIIHSFLDTEVGQRSPEFYLLVLLLFWPEEQRHVNQGDHEEEVEQQAAEDSAGSQNSAWQDKSRHEEQEARRGESADKLMSDPDLQEQVTFMKKAFKREYAKYLRGRYLCPLFFLGKGLGLSKWIHKSRLDIIVEQQVEQLVSAELPNERRESKKWKRIHNMWTSGKVFQIPQIQNMLRPVQAKWELPTTLPVLSDHTKEKKIMAELSPTKIQMLFYLGFTIEGPVVFSSYSTGP